MLKMLYAAGLFLALATPIAAANATVYTFTSFDAPIDLGPPGGAGAYVVGTTVTGINKFGQVVGTANGITGQSGFILDLATNTYTLYPNFPILAINDSGQLLGLSGYTAPKNANVLASVGDGYGIDNAGEIVGYTGNGARNPSYQGYILNPATGSVTRLNDPASGNGGRTATRPSDINNSGQIIGTVLLSASQYLEGFVLDRSTGLYTTLYDPAGVFNYPTGINDVGQIVGTDSAGAYVLDLATGTYTILTFPGAVAIYPTGISNSGVIVGDYSYSNAADPSNYYYHGFIAIPQASATVPEPASMTLLGGSLLGLYCARRWRAETDADPPLA